MNSKNLVLGGILSLFLIASYFIYKKLNPKQLPPYLIQAVGRIDGNLIDINAKYPARVIELDVDVGDEVEKNKLLAKLNDDELKNKISAITYEIKAEENRLNFIKQKIENGIKKAEFAVKAKQNELFALQSEIDSLKSVIKQDEKDEKRIYSLVKRKLAKHHEYELTTLKLKTDKDKLKGLYSKEKSLKNMVDILKMDLKTALSEKENITSLENKIAALNSQKAELLTMDKNFILRSPVNGYVDEKIANVGEVVGSGMGVVSVIDKNSFYLKIYVDELTNGKIKIGDKAEIFLDSFPNKPIAAIVSKIAQKAEFTPKDVAVRSDRITKVYEVHLKPLKQSPYFKLGLPAIGVILIGKGSLPTSLSQMPQI